MASIERVRFEGLYKVAKLDVLSEETCMPSVEGVWKDSSASDVAVSEE